MDWMRKMKHAVQRTADRATGRHVSVETGAEPMHGALRSPPVDIFENDEEVLLIADMPGVSPADARVGYDPGRAVLFIGGATARGDEFGRTFELPGHLDPDDARVVASRGVLRVHLPKRSDAPGRPIPVRAAPA